MKKRLTVALALGLMIPAVTPAAAAGKDLTINSIKFNSMKAPATIEEMVQTYTGASMDITYSNGATKNFPLTYKQLYLSDEKIVTNKGVKIPAGTPIDAKGNPIMDKSIPGQESYYISDAPDSNSLMNVGGNLFLVSHFEYQTLDSAGNSAYGVVPASMTLTALNQNKKNGELSIKEAKKVDFSLVNGLWIPCNGSTSPWGTHLGSEEYEPNARQFEAEIGTDKDSTNVKGFAKLYFGDETKGNPYNYGWIPEVTVQPNGDSSVVKHYSTGRFSHEMMEVMPDNKTAFFGDDGNYTVSFMYIADKEKDLSAGTLYAAKFSQTSAENGGAGSLEWINLGHATDDEVRAIIDKGTKFSDIFETASQPTEGFTAVKTDSSGAKIEYLKVKPGMEKAAAFLESRRYAALKGATAEFRKMEGLAVNAKDKKVYMAMSEIGKGMLEDTKMADPVDDIRLPQILAGGTYELSLTGGQKDKDGNTINSSYVASTMKALVVGEDLSAPDAYGNKANPNKVSKPDNLSYSETMRTLFIGEDGGEHTNNFVWGYNIDTKELSRVLSVPVGAEATGLRVLDNFNGFSYILSNYQHPGDELKNFQGTAVDKQALEKAMEEGIGILKKGGIGYIAGMPQLNDLHVGWHFTSGKWFFYNENGVMQTGWVKVGPKWYFLEDSGEMKTGWLKDGTKWYYLASSGEMETGWVKYGSKWYYLASSGEMKSGWVKDGAKWYYLASSGEMKTGWVKDGAKWYYLESSGEMKTGWVKVGTKWYYLASSGEMKTGWIQVGQKWYYLNDDGSMAANTTIQGYKINKNGEWIK
ncbi:alkaline phosphatase PhoX [Bacillus salipaludis]|uniref:Alkaline phosphatase PhoX n=1 Tax=Bacillus salipaludis TaxID=2547811 RepID=A0ABW8REY9_9BACI